MPKAETETEKKKSPVRSDGVRSSDESESAAIDDTHSSSVTQIAEAADGAVTENGESITRNMYRAMEHDIPEYRKMLELAGFDKNTINNLFITVDKVMEKVKEHLDILDYSYDEDIDDRGFNPVKQNSDPLYKVSVDFSTLCRKRILQQTIQIQLQTALNRSLTKEENIAIRDALKQIQAEGRAIEIACALCYVESARMKSYTQIQRFLDNRGQILHDYFAGKDVATKKGKQALAESRAREELGRKWRTAEEQAKYRKQIDEGKFADPSATMVLKNGKTKYSTALKQMPEEYKAIIRAAKKSVFTEYEPTAEETELIRIAENLPVESFTSPEGLEELIKKYPRIFAAYTAHVGNASHSKGIENDTWWRAGDSATISDGLIAKMNGENGLRSQSWSDFQVIHILDYIASTIELSARGSKLQVYTKVPAYVHLMGLTNAMMNLSLISTPKFSGTLDFDGVEGMPLKTALALRDAYPSVAGTICVGISDPHIRALLAASYIDYVIPYHHSSMSAKTRKAMHIPAWKSFESVQNEKNLSGTDARSNAKKYGVDLKSADDEMWHKAPLFSEWFNYDTARKTAQFYNEAAGSGVLSDTEQTQHKEYGVMFGAYKAMQEAAENYKKICAERGLQVKFEEFSNEENYWKLLIDRKMINNKTGEIIQQKTLQPVFDTDKILSILNDEVANYPGVKADEEYAVRTVVQKFLSGNMNADITSVEKITGAVNKAVDNVTKVNILSSSDYRYSIPGNLSETRQSTRKKFNTKNDINIAKNKRQVYNERETLFMQWAYGSAPPGELKALVRGDGKCYFYEKTVEGAVELSEGKYNEQLKQKTYAIARAETDGNPDTAGVGSVGNYFPVDTSGNSERSGRVRGISATDQFRSGLSADAEESAGNTFGASSSEEGLSKSGRKSVRADTSYTEEFYSIVGREIAAAEKNAKNETESDWLNRYQKKLTEVNATNERLKAERAKVKALSENTGDGTADELAKAKANVKTLSAKLSRQRVTFTGRSA